MIGTNVDARFDCVEAAAMISRDQMYRCISLKIIIAFKEQKIEVNKRIILLSMNFHSMN